MNILITPKEQICKELTDIDSFLNITMSEVDSLVNTDFNPSLSLSRLRYMRRNPETGRLHLRL